jgi:hypothetical protein
MFCPARQATALLCLIVSLMGAKYGVAADESAVPSPIDKIDQLIERNWTDYGLKPSKIEDDAKWARRVYLDLLGRIPTSQETEEFVKQRAKDKRQRLVERLLGDGEYTEEFAHHWSAVWSNILIGRSAGNNRNSIVNREGLAKYLRDSFARNKPYDNLVYELVTATGTNKPGTPGFNGATNFLADKVNDEKGTLATAATSRIFLGMQVQCTQCHNHPFNQWKQDKFWEFNAFFRQTRALRRFVSGTNDIDHIELVNEDFGGEGRVSRPEEAVVYFEERNGLMKSAFPIFVDGTEINRSGYLTEVNRRDELGRLIVGSEYLSRMMVNRMWAHFLGYGFSRPMDDLGPHSQLSHPELLDSLSQDFMDSQYDIRELIRWIVLSKPYQLSSVITRENEEDDPAMGAMPQFSRFYMRQMTAEQLYQSLVTVSGQHSASLEQQRNERDRWLNQFVVEFGTDEGDESTTFNGSIPQALMMFNGELVQRACETGPGSLIGEVISKSNRLPDQVHSLFFAGLSRRATAKELEFAAQLLRARGGKVEEALQDLWWAILNSNEFIFVH